MKPINYGLSFISGRWPENRVRFWVESRMRYIDEVNKITEDYYQCGACKSEDTFAEKDLFYKDNYDFTPVFGPEHGIIFRRKAYLNDNYKSCLKAADMWQGQDYKLKEADHAKLLESNADIRRATHEAIPLVAQTEIANEELGIRAIIEYPIKTMNINDDRDIYQVDTGPVLLPDLSKRHERIVDGISLAYIAFNVSTVADFVIEAPTPVMENGKEICKVYHYSRIISLKSKNTVYEAY